MLSFEWNFLGLSSETKPKDNEKVIDGSSYYECDTGDFYIYYKDNWYKQTFQTDDGINVYVYKLLIRKMFKKLFDSNISKTHIITPDTGSEIEFSSDFPSNITVLTGYGNTTQQIYSGKNLFSGYTKGINLNPTNGSQTTSSKSTCSDYIPVDITGDNKFTISGLPTTLFNFVAAYNSEHVFLGRTGAGAEGTRTLGSTSFNNGTPQGSGDIAYIRVPVYENASVSGTISDIDDAQIQLEVGEVATSYEPYTGSVYPTITPSPSPDYPQDVNVVKGEQTITFTNDNLTQAYIVDLGSTELCKIGVHEDYIYKSNDDWYIHKEIGKYTFIGNENWSSGAYGTNSWVVNGLLTGYLYSEDAVNTACDFSKGVAFNKRGSSDSTNTCVCYYSNVGQLNIRNTTLTSQAQMQTATTNKNIYYWITPIDTKITDTTLINTLNNILEYVMPIGNNSIKVTATDLTLLLKLTITERE